MNKRPPNNLTSCTLRVQTPAKINLHLRVGDVRHDGFHPLASWMVSVGLFDFLTFRWTLKDESAVVDQSKIEAVSTTSSELPLTCEQAHVTPKDNMQVRLSCNDPTLSVGSDNLIVKAINASLSAFGLSESVDSVRVTLDKRIPVGGGLGGGSSDAAAAILATYWVGQELIRQRDSVHQVTQQDIIVRAVNARQTDQVGLNFNDDLITDLGDQIRLSQIAASIGSDVPFFLHGTSAVARGRGEVLQAVEPPSVWAVLFPQTFGVSTGVVYRTLDRIRPIASSETLAPFDVEQWAKLSAAELLERLENDLESPAFVVEPRLADALQKLESLLGQTVRMTGSGSTFFTLCDTLQHAKNLANIVNQTPGQSAVVAKVGEAKIAIESGERG